MISTGTASNAARTALDMTHDDLLAAANELSLLYESAQWYTMEVASAILNRGTLVAEMRVADLLTIVRQTGASWHCEPSPPSSSRPGPRP